MRSCSNECVDFKAKISPGCLCGRTIPTEISYLIDTNMKNSNSNSNSKTQRHKDKKTNTHTQIQKNTKYTITKKIRTQKVKCSDSASQLLGVRVAFVIR